MSEDGRDITFALKSPERKYEETGDHRYAMVAIGESPDDPPAWAIRACEEFARAYRLDVNRFDDPKRKGGSPHYSESDGRLLDEMERLFESGDRRVHVEVDHPSGRSALRPRIKAAARLVAEGAIELPRNASVDVVDRVEALREATVRRLERLWKRETSGRYEGNYVQANYRLRGMGIKRFEEDTTDAMAAPEDA